MCRRTANISGNGNQHGPDILSIRNSGDESTAERTSRSVSTTVHGSNVTTVLSQGSSDGRCSRSTRMRRQRGSSALHASPHSMRLCLHASVPLTRYRQPPHRRPASLSSRFASRQRQFARHLCSSMSSSLRWGRPRFPHQSHLHKYQQRHPARFFRPGRPHVRDRRRPHGPSPQRAYADSGVRHHCPFRVSHQAR